MVNTRLTNIRRRVERGRRFSFPPIAWRRVLPDFGDLVLLIGILLLGNVLYRLAPLLAETYAAALLIFVGIIRGGYWRGPR